TDGGPPQPGMEENFLQGWRDGLSESWQRLQESSTEPAIDWSSVRVDLLEVWEVCKRGLLQGGAKLSVRGQSDNHTLWIEDLQATPWGWRHGVFKTPEPATP
ncbi:MAG: hypothetical protein ACR2RL_02995, partial [Gammaproteobacteria bacterium]